MKNGGADPYRLYNSLDDSYRPLTYRHPCPRCWSFRMGGGSERCPLCHWRGYIDVPLEEPGDPRPPSRPARVRMFVYGISAALAELEAGQAGRRERPIEGG